MKAISLKRKQRIAKVRKKKMSARNKKMAAATIAGAISALVLMNGKAAAYGKDYTVKKRDTLYSLSKKYQVSIDQLIKTNSLTSEKIVVGQRLVVSEQGKTMVPKSEEMTNQYTVQKGDSLFLLAKKYGITLEKLKEINNIQSDRINIGQKIVVPLETSNYGEEEKYTVVSGDTLWGIAKRFGVTVENLANENGLKKEMVLIGQRLIIPGAAEISEAEVVGAADSFTVEFEQRGKPLVLEVPYGSASDYQKKSGQKVTVIHKNGAVISVF